jgi:hypothetical protein
MKQKPQTGDLSNSQKTGAFLLNRYRKDKLDKLIKKEQRAKEDYERAFEETELYIESLRT